MARIPRNGRFIQELAALSPEERLRKVTDAIARGFCTKRFKPLPPGWELPTLRGGDRWVGGDLRREDLSGDDGR